MGSSELLGRLCSSSFCWIGLGFFAAKVKQKGFFPSPSPEAVPGILSALCYFSLIYSGFLVFFFFFFGRSGEPAGPPRPRGLLEELNRREMKLKSTDFSRCKTHARNPTGSSFYERFFCFVLIDKEGQSRPLPLSHMVRWGLSFIKIFFPFFLVVVVCFFY